MFCHLLRSFLLVAASLTNTVKAVFTGSVVAKVFGVGEFYAAATSAFFIVGF
jgi:hypothetical protein